MATTPESIAPPPTFAAVLALIETLRGEQGCPWDRKQTPASAITYLVEEAFELMEAVIADDTDAILEEMGDVLFQVLFLMVLYRQAGRFKPTEVLACNLRKMIHRHPHVFGGDTLDDADQVKRRWREIKQQEKGKDRPSVLDAVPSGLPALLRAYRVSERAAGIGFDWDDLAGVTVQAESEWAEFNAERNRMPEGDGTTRKDRMAEELGDVLFTLVNVARLAGIHPETALTAATEKFVGRFKQMERMAADQGKRLDEVPRQGLDAFWERVKAREQDAGQATSPSDAPPGSDDR
ncbi:nucleoside triphosphate pyrophosphohydrolase [Desulfatitalea alkaliphila]|uniref:Nucleoside triphosphate pyrophosphohydrolase n=1 Tax=Desulfatitalea alkaliphila TaxID=2929485 RepID=A0AA41UIG7_9BACT|nr:nucleoside triphosphate pyrophosphohydrolase [Desulfatitalea alkaliphila]MCJ8500069.1 nucleoside triphosphate pyrophosphohydrolase [Desulfatitalea alkaliphila]